MFTSMQEVLTLQFSAALELTNDSGRKGCTGSSLRSSSGQKMAGQSSRQYRANAMESGAPEPQALHFADVQLLAKPGSHPQVCCTFQTFVYAALQMKTYFRT